MAFKLTRQELNRRDEIVNDLRSKLTLLEQTLEQDPQNPDDTTNAAAVFTVVVNEAEEFRDEVATRLREEFDNRSEKWQESDAGDEASGLIDEWESADFSSCDLDLLDPEIDGLESYADDLEALPIEL